MSEDKPTIRILIIFYSRFGAIKLLAERIGEGARRLPDVETVFLDVEDWPVDEGRPGEIPRDRDERRTRALDQMEAADALIVGAPAYFGSMASAVKRLFEDCVTDANPPAFDRSRPWWHHLFRDKVGAAFTASGTPHGGNEQTLHSILTMMMHLGMIIVTPGQGEPILVDQAAPYGATTITGARGHQEPSEAEQEAARRLGGRVATVTSWLALGKRDVGADR